MAANTSTRILPSPLGGGLTRGAQGFVEARELNRKNALDRDKADLDERRVNIQDQAFSFNRLLQFGALMPPGTSLKDNPFMSQLARDSFGDLDPETFEAVLGMIPNRETIQTIIEEQQKLFAQGLDPENEEDQQILTDIGISGLNLGVSTEAQLRNRGLVEGLTGEALKNFTTDTRIQGDIALQQLGLQATVRIPNLVDPLTGEVIEHESIDAARIYALVSNARDSLFSAGLRFTAENRNDLAAELIEMSEKAGMGIQRPKANQIIRAYEASVNVPQGEISPYEVMFNRATPEVQRAMKLFTGVIDLGDDSFDLFLQESQVGRSLAFLGQLGEFIQEEMGIPSNQMMGIFQDLLGSGIAGEGGMKVTGGFLRRRRFDLGETATTGNRGSLEIVDGEPISLGAAIGRSNQPGGNGDTPPLPDFTNVDVTAIATLLRRGDLTEEIARATWPADLVDASIRMNQENP